MTMHVGAYHRSGSLKKCLEHLVHTKVASPSKCIVNNNPDIVRAKRGIVRLSAALPAYKRGFHRNAQRYRAVYAFYAVIADVAPKMPIPMNTKIMQRRLLCVNSKLSEYSCKPTEAMIPAVLG